MLLLLSFYVFNNVRYFLLITKNFLTKPLTPKSFTIRETTRQRHFLWILNSKINCKLKKRNSKCLPESYETTVRSRSLELVLKWIVPPFSFQNAHSDLIEMMTILFSEKQRRSSNNSILWGKRKLLKRNVSSSI